MSFVVLLLCGCLFVCCLWVVSGWIFTVKIVYFCLYLLFVVG